MTFERTRDFGLVRAVLTHPSQVRMSADDGTDPVNWSPCEDERVLYVAARLGAYDPVRHLPADELLGIFTLIPQNAVCCEIHAALLPFAWGVRTREALRGALAWSFENTPARRIVCGIPAYNKLAIKLAKDCGFRAYGRNPASWLRHATLHDLVLLGISRP